MPRMRWSSSCVVHILREFSLDRLRGKRFFAWLTGIPLLGFIYLCGISGYWLVWDKLAQYIAIATSEWLDVLPVFGQPIANNFLDGTTLGGRFFTLMVFIHIFGPLILLLLMWVHIQRHSNARVNPPKPLALGTLAMLLGLAIVYPATSQGPADLDVGTGERRARLVLPARVSAPRRRPGWAIVAVAGCRGPRPGAAAMDATRETRAVRRS